MQAFLKFATDWLLTQERLEAQTRSGVALLARRLRQPLTDFAIALLENEKFVDALWTLDFRDRSRDTQRLHMARRSLENSSIEARASVVQYIEDWLRFDNPLSLEMSYTAVGFDEANIQLRSEIAAKRLNIEDTAAIFPTVEEIANLAGELGVSRRVAWLLIGTYRSGWLVLQASDEKPVFAYVPLDYTRADLLALLNRRFRDPSTSEGPFQTFFEIRETDRQDPANVRLWQIALAAISREISARLLEPLMAELGFVPDPTGSGTVNSNRAQRTCRFPVPRNCRQPNSARLWSCADRLFSGDLCRRFIGFAGLNNPGAPGRKPASTYSGDSVTSQSQIPTACQFTVTCSGGNPPFL